MHTPSNKSASSSLEIFAKSSLKTKFWDQMWEKVDVRHLIFLLQVQVCIKIRRKKKSHIQIKNCLVNHFSYYFNHTLLDLTTVVLFACLLVVSREGIKND